MNANMNGNISTLMETGTRDNIQEDARSVGLLRMLSTKAIGNGKEHGTKRSVMAVTESSGPLYIPDDKIKDVTVWPWREYVEIRVHGEDEWYKRVLEGYVQEKIWDIGDRDPLLAHVLEIMYIELRAMKERLLELEEKLEECESRGFE